MVKRRLGRGPLQVVLLSGFAPAQLVLRDDVGTVAMLPVQVEDLASVRIHLEQACSEVSWGNRPCLVELRDADDGVRDRWGTFVDVGAGAAVAVVLLAGDRHADHAILLPVNRGLEAPLRLDGRPRTALAGPPWST